MIDLSHDLHPDTPVFPGAAPVEVTILERSQDPPAKGRRSLNVSRFSTVVHTGTHMDAPFHFFEAGPTIEKIPLEQCTGPTVLVDLRHIAPGAEVSPREFEPYRESLLRTRKAVLNTGWAQKWGDPGYFTEHPRLSGEAAEFLIACGVHLVGVDMPSVDRSPYPAHLALLGSGAVIVENLTNLDAIGSQVFQIFVVPLKIRGRDGSPVRAIATEV